MNDKGSSRKAARVRAGARGRAGRRGRIGGRGAGGARASKRAALVAAAKELLWRFGYEAMSPAKVLAASGAGQGSLYHHFAGKKDLAAAALDEIEAEMRAGLDQALAAGPPPLARIERFLAAPRDSLKGCRLGRLANEASIADETLRRPIARYFAYLQGRLAETLAEAVRRGDLAPETDVATLAAMLVAVVQGGFILARVHRDTRLFDRAMDGAIASLRALASEGTEP